MHRIIGRQLVTKHIRPSAFSSARAISSLETPQGLSPWNFEKIFDRCHHCFNVVFRHPFAQLRHSGLPNFTSINVTEEESHHDCTGISIFDIEGLFQRCRGCGWISQSIAYHVCPWAEIPDEEDEELSRY